MQCALFSIFLSSIFFRIWSQIFSLVLETRNIELKWTAIDGGTITSSLKFYMCTFCYSIFCLFSRWLFSILFVDFFHSAFPALFSFVVCYLIPLRVLYNALPQNLCPVTCNLLRKSLLLFSFCCVGYCAQPCDMIQMIVYCVQTQ